jgi:hypothetical protein
MFRTAQYSQCEHIYCMDWWIECKQAYSLVKSLTGSYCSDICLSYLSAKWGLSVMCSVYHIQLTIKFGLVHNIVALWSVLLGFGVSRLGMNNERDW